MRSLVIETATEACSVALVEDGRVIAAVHEVVGRGHAERLLPMIAELPDGGWAGHILVDCGPGSFTGVRVGLAAARGLALGWGAEVAGYRSLALIAAARFAGVDSPPALAVVIEGGHGELFMQSYAAPPLAEIDDLRSLKPEAALAALAGLPAIGRGTRRLAVLDPAVAVEDAEPRAADTVLLPPAFRSLPARPVYGRPPDAKPMA